MTFSDGVHHGDCLEGLAKLPDDCAQMVFADPPFNLRKKYKAHKDKMDAGDYLHWCELWIGEMVRVVKPGGAVFVHNIPKWLTFYAAILNRLAVFKHWIAWDAPTSPMGKSLLPSHYGILYYVKDGARAKFRDIRFPHPRCRKCKCLRRDYGGKKDGLHPFGPLASDVWSDIHRIRHSSRRDEHPCQLPVALLERLTLMSTDEGDLILDPFMGTGTTAVAAKRLGRRHLGFELSAEYADIARRKAERELATSRLGDAYVSFHLNKVVTIRHDDWDVLAPFFVFASPPREIDRVPTQLLVNAPNAARPPMAICACDKAQASLPAIAEQAPQSGGH